jgi:hypothetical protein
VEQATERKLHLAVREAAKWEKSVPRDRALRHIAESAPGAARWSFIKSSARKQEPNIGQHWLGFVSFSTNFGEFIARHLGADRQIHEKRLALCRA